MATTIATIEKPEPRNRWWKIKNLIVKGWIFLKYSSGKGHKQNIFRVFFFFFTKAGIVFIQHFWARLILLLFNYDIIGRRAKRIYKRWYPKHIAGESSLKKFKKKADAFSYRPLISILILDSRGDIAATERTLRSISEQVYPVWETGIASVMTEQINPLQETIFPPGTRTFLLPTQKNQNSSLIRNKLLETTKGEFILYMNAGDLLVKETLYHWVKYLQTNPQTDLLYSDEDRMDRKGNPSLPVFKSDWSPDTLLSYNYLGKSVLLRQSLIRFCGNFREEFAGEELYDLYLRATEHTKHIRHFKKILYRHKIQPQKTDEVLFKKLIEETLSRRNESGQVLMKQDKGIISATIRYRIKKFSKISILIPTKDNTSLLRQCVESIFANSSYPDFEVIVIDNNSVEQDFFDYINSCRKNFPDRFSCIRYEVPFNFSKINNFAASHAKGEYLVLLNNDTKVISTDWLEGMLEQVQRETTGVVGVKLLYPDDSIQHAGIGFDEKRLPYHVYAGEQKDIPAPVNILSNYPALTAACIMIKKELYEKVGGLDETLAVEFNDIDFCLRIKKKGYYNIYLPHVELYHYESLSRGSSHSTGEKYERHLKEKNLFLSRWFDYIKEVSVQYLSYNRIL